MFRWSPHHSSSATSAARTGRIDARGELSGPFDRGKGGPAGWILLDEPELHLHGDILVPDLAGWRRERMPRLPMQATSFELAPDWTCEVLSPSTAPIDRADKMPIYARERGGHIWLIDPVLKTLEVYRLDGATYRTIATFWGDAAVRAEPFAAIEIELAALWSE